MWDKYNGFSLHFGEELNKKEILRLARDCFNLRKVMWEAHYRSSNVCCVRVLLWLAHNLANLQLTIGMLC